MSATPILMAAAVAVPLVAAPLSLHRAWAGAVALAAGVGTTAAAIGLVLAVARDGAVRHALGGWPAPLGIVWNLDGLAAILLATAALVALPVAVFATASLPREHLGREAHRFWPPFLFLWAGLNALFLSGDVFNIYVALELVSLAAVMLVTLEGRAAALAAGLRYLLVAQAGALTYLLGVAFLYARHGTLDVGLLTAAAAVGDMPTTVAAVLMTGGLFAKAALFPLHAWLPPAHGSAPAPASALLSGLVVMAAAYVILRLWFDVFAAVGGAPLRQGLGALGAAGVIWGSLLALSQRRLKAVIAYSTTAQMGYLLLAIPLAAPAADWSADPWAGAIMLAVAHAFAKAAMFLATGLIIQATGQDRIGSMRGVARRMPVTAYAIGVAGLTLMGLPPSGGFAAKWLLLRAAWSDGQWWWVLVLLGGGLLAAAYVFRIIGPAFSHSKARKRQPPRPLEWIALGMAAASLLMGLAAMPLVAVLARSGGGA